MKDIANNLFEVTIGLLLFTWVLVNNSAFSQVIGSVGSAVSGAVNTVWAEKAPPR